MLPCVGNNRTVNIVLEVTSEVLEKKQNIWHCVGNAKTFGTMLEIVEHLTLCCKNIADTDKNNTKITTTDIVQCYVFT